MIKILFAILFAVNVAWPACNKINMPTDYSIVANGTRANLKANFDEVQTKTNPCMDSVDEVRGRFTGYTGSFGIYSLENMRLRLDSDASTTARLSVENSNGDSLFRVSEDSSAKVFGALSVAGASTFTGSAVLSNNLTLSLFATGRIPYTTTAGLLTSGTGLTYDGSAFNVTGSAAISGNLSLLGSQDILFADNSGTALTFKEGGNPYLRFVTTNGAEKITAFKAIDATGGNITLGTSSNAYDFMFNGPTANNRNLFWQTAGLNRWKIFTNSTAETGSNAGSDLSIAAYNDAGSLNGTALTITRSNRTAAFGDNVTVGGTLGVTGATTLTGNVGIGGNSSVSAALDLTSSGMTGSTQFGIASGPTFGTAAITAGYAGYFKLTNSGSFTMGTGAGLFVVGPTLGASTVTNLIGLDIASQTGGTNNYAIRTGASGLIQLGSLTASSAVATDASKNLISVTNTGTGNNVLSASPTLTGTINAASQTLSGTLGVTGVTTATGGLTLGASFVDKTTTITSNTTLTTAHSTIFADASSGTITVTLPAASGNTGLIYTFYKIDISAPATGGGNLLTVDGNASETIGGTLQKVMMSNTGQSRLKIICDGSNWQILDQYEEGTFTLTMTGCVSNPTTTAYWARTGRQCTLRAGALSGTSNSASTTLTGYPTALLNSNGTIYTSYNEVQDNGTSYLGNVVMTPGGWTVYYKATYTSAPTATFTTSGTKAVYVDLSYTTQ